MRLFNAMLLFAIFPVSGTQADVLGRLFFSPEQRAQLEYSHARNAAADGSGAPSMLMVNGIVQQHGGPRTVWINGKAQDSGHGGEPAAEAVAVPGKPNTTQTSSVRIKVGQKLLLDTTAPQNSPASAE